ncbi:concanavalin A-like lectin/glucanase [Stipitochalara longipes BDJ]|nr:concanavalin A-like lectin/glucanase [Stipitochalara longipes BDJ]
MRFFNLFSATLFATTTIAVPRCTELGRRALRRAAGTRNGRLSEIRGDEYVSDSETGDNANTVYTSNWTGSMIMGPPSGEIFNYIHGQFVAPVLSQTAGSAGIWIGLDGCTYPTILQAGIDFNAHSDGSTSYSAWYEWYPAANIDLARSDFSLKAGDEIDIAIEALNSTHGNIILKNLSTGVTVVHDISAPDPSSALGGQTAEWIVEDYTVGNVTVAFTNFGSVHFTDSYARTDKGSQVGADTGDMVELVDSKGKVITQVAMAGFDGVAVTYSG